MSLAKILDKINQFKSIAEEEVDIGPRETLAAKRGRKRQALDNLKTLREEYIADLMKSAVFILVTGATHNEFTSTAVENFGCFVSNPDDFYTDLANRVPTVLYLNKDTVASMFDVLGRHLEDKALEMHIIGYPQLTFKQKYQKMIQSKEEFVALVRDAVNQEIGGEMAGIHAVRAIADDAIAKNHNSKITPIIFNCSSEKLAIELIPALERLNPKVFFVVAGKASKLAKNVDQALIVKEINTSSVEEVLTKIKNSIKK